MAAISAKITVCSLDMLEKMVSQTSASHIVSLINRQMMPDTPRQLARGNHLKLCMNDIESPVSGSVLPCDRHIEQLVEFVEQWEQKKPLIIHCWAGISRSTAAAFVSLCALNPQVDETEIARLMRQKSPTATPNSLLISCADKILQRNGKMITAIEEIGRGKVASVGSAFSLPALLDGGR